MLRCSTETVSWLLAAVMLVLVVGCTDDDKGLNSSAVPIVTTSAVTNITQTTAQCGGEITSDGGTIVVARGICWSTSASPTVAESRTTDGIGAGTFASNMTGLTAGIAYHVRAYAINSTDTGYGATRSFTASPVTDIDGNVYQTVTIGTQVWLKENLKVTHYRTGDPIPNVTDEDGWFALTSGAYVDCVNDVNNAAVYGRLYNWYAVNDSRNIAPVGWHVATDDEWKQLEMYLGMSQADADTTFYRGTVEGGMLKEADTVHWLSPNTGATNASGFTALPGGIRSLLGFEMVGYAASFWSSTARESDDAWSRRLNYMNSQVNRSARYKKDGLSVRCIRD